VLSEIVNRSEPHAEFKNVIDVALQIRDFNKTPALVESAPDYIKQITEKCWASDPEDRPVSINSKFSCYIVLILYL
jgi:hypothetical protein